MNYKELEKEWRVSQIYLSGREWLSIFPEAKPRIKELIAGYSSVAEKLNMEVHDDLVAIHKLKSDEFSTWFAEQIIKVWKGNKLEELIKKIKHLKGFLMKPKKGEITDEEIENSRHYDFRILLPDADNRSQMGHCPFHPDKKPSFYVRNGWGYCFGCGWHGNAIDFLMKRDGLSFREAVKKLQ
jgi:hypothetical protein